MTGLENAQIALLFVMVILGSLNFVMSQSLRVKVQAQCEDVFEGVAEFHYPRLSRLNRGSDSLRMITKSLTI